MFNNATDMIHLVDPDGRIIDANQIELEKMGFSREEYVGKLFKDLIHPDYRELSMAAARKVFAGEPIVGYETVMVSRDGTPISVEVYSTPFIVAGKVVYARFIIHDISARKHVEAELAEYQEELEELVNLRSRELKESEENYRSLFDLSDDANMILDREGFLDCNQATLEMFGCASKEEFLGKHPSEISTPLQADGVESRIAADERIATAYQKGKNFFEWICRRINGDDFPVEVLLTPMNLAGKNVLQAIVRDITERKKADLSLIDARNEAERANQAKSKFLSSMSHELRTPMNAILGYGQLLESNPKEPLTETQKKCVNHILKGGAHLLDLINDLLDLAKIEAGRVELSIEDVQAAEVIDECLSLMSPLAEERNIDFTTPDTSELASLIRADRTRFNQVLLNLLSNAIKYNREGGNVIILFQETADDMLRVSVTDTGKGIPKENQWKIFQPFSRLGAEHTEIEGTGIGLVVCKNLLELMEGRIGFESRVGKGSTFWIELPLVREKATVAEAAKGATTETMKRMPEIRGAILK